MALRNKNYVIVPNAATPHLLVIELEEWDNGGYELVSIGNKHTVYKKKPRSQRALDVANFALKEIYNSIWSDDPEGVEKAKKIAWDALQETL